MILTQNLELELPGPYFTTFTLILVLKGAQNFTVLADASRRCNVPSAPEKESHSEYGALPDISFISPMYHDRSCCIVVLSASSTRLQQNHKQRHSAQGSSSEEVHITVNYPCRKEYFCHPSLFPTRPLCECICVCVCVTFRSLDPFFV